MERDPRTGELFNADRADRAQAALDAYIEYTGDRPDESHFRDLLCDLRHLAMRDGAGEFMKRLTFDEANEMAGRCFEDEVSIEANADDVEEVDINDVVGVPGGLLVEPVGPPPIAPPPILDWSKPVQWSTGEEITFAPYDNPRDGYRSVSSCAEWSKITGDNYVHVGEDGEIMGVEGEYPAVVNVPEGGAA